MNHSPFPIEQDFLNLTLSKRTSSPPASNAAVPSPAELQRSLCSLSIITPSPSNPASLSSITPRSSITHEFDPTLYQQHMAVGGSWYHQHTAVGGSSYHQPTVLGGPWVHLSTAVGGTSYLQSSHPQPTMVGGPSHPQPTTIGGPSINQPAPVGDLSNHQPMVVGGPSHHQLTSVGGPSHPQPMAVEGPSNHQSTSVGRPSHRQSKSAGGPSRHQPMVARGRICKNRMSRKTSIRLKPGKNETIPPPYPWATDHRAIIHDIQSIQSKGIKTITGRVKCTECNQEFDIEYDLQVKFQEVQRFVIENKDAMWQRAPDVWRSPVVPDCKFCNQKKCAKPIWGKRRSINWLFLLLGQMIGCCKLAELKYFCKYTRNHRTGAKDRVLYSTYLELCRQLDPEGDYDP